MLRTSIMRGKHQCQVGQKVFQVCLKTMKMVTGTVVKVTKVTYHVEFDDAEGGQSDRSWSVYETVAFDTAYSDVWWSATRTGGGRSYRWVARRMSALWRLEGKLAKNMCTSSHHDGR